MAAANRRTAMRQAREAAKARQFVARSGARRQVRAAGRHTTVQSVSAAPAVAAAPPVVSTVPAATVARPVVAARPTAAKGHPANRGDGVHIVFAGESLWSIANDVLGGRPGVARVAREVNRLWELNAEQIGTGNRDLLPVGTRLVLK